LISGISIFMGSDFDFLAISDNLAEGLHWLRHDGFCLFRA